MQGLLQVDDNLALVGQGERDHRAHALVVNVKRRAVVQMIASQLQLCQQMFCMVQKLLVAHVLHSWGSMGLGVVVYKFEFSLVPRRPCL